ncbi:hypothetical protein NEFER03_0032 [Nematocida sp. LUAm3]|nr:hypothetical protein NEFER03_0032 [Nematocida sp. LUAm3]KAI5176248.1 hypothetical protein NEFER02_2045 [Nematocida sp. LUAm2]KAI5176706.1 hypothetical protein NEFER01_0031 [Nematocida sp. LUAm1]
MEKLYTVEGYSVEKFVGEGAYALVFLARDTATNKEHALKAVHKGRRRTKGTAHAMKEVKALARLKGVQGIVEMKEWKEDENTIYLILSYHEGPSLSEMQVYLSDIAILHLSISLLESVQFMHQRGVYHLDIKPQNVIVTKKGPILVDFGCSIVSGNRKIEKHDLLFDGTPSYMAPEMVKYPSTEEVSLASLDIWGFGCLLYYMFTRKDAFSSTSLYSLYPKILACDVNLQNTPAYIHRVLKRIFVVPAEKRIAIEPLIDLLSETLNEL